MHLDYTFHFWPAVEYLSSFITGTTFLYQTYRQIRRGVNAFEVMIEQHHEMYGWYLTEIKPNRKPNGAARL